MTSKYLAGWEIDFNNIEELKKILVTQGIDQDGFEYFKHFQTVTELIYDNNLISKTILHSRFMIEEQRHPGYILPDIKWEERKPFHLIKSKKGVHSMGGQKPKDFIVPKVQTINSSFIFIASIDCKDSNFEWIGLEKLHKCYPIYEGIFEIFFDYSDPLKPTIINPETFEWSWLNVKDTRSEKIFFEEQKYISTSNYYYNDIERNPEDYLLCGVPLWYQAPQIPICPITGKVMKFVATINSDPHIKISNEVNLDRLEYKELPYISDYLNFGSHGNMFVFYEPSSKVLYLNCQI